MKKLNLGCGKNIKSKSEGWVNLDRFKGKGVDVVHNLDKFPYPFKDNEFDYVYSRSVIEELNNLRESLDEVWRICKKDAIVEIITPHKHHDANFVHPYDSHNWICKETFNYYKEIPDLKNKKTNFTVLEEKNYSYGRFKRFLPFKKILSQFLWNVYDKTILKVRVIK